MALQNGGDVSDMINKYSKTVYRLAFSQTRNKEDADDIFQEVFLRYVKKQPVFENEEHEKAWFLRVTVNCCKSLWASAWRRNTEALDENMASYDNVHEPVLEQYLDKLPKDYRAVLHLFYYEQMSTQQIAQTLKKNESTVRVQLTRARRMLKDVLGDDLIE